MTKEYSRFLTALFCAFLGTMLIWSLLLPDRTRSEAENRVLQQRPAFSWAALVSGDYTADVEKYLADQFPLRDRWTGLRARMDRLVGKTEFKGVYLCGDDTLIAKTDTPDEKLVEDNLRFAARLAEQTDARVYLGLIPSAAEVWREKLPCGAESWDQAAFLNTAAEKTGLPQIDFLSELRAHSEEAIYYRTDHHWTTPGAYYGSLAVLDALGRRDEAASADSFVPEIAGTSFRGTLYSASGVHWLKPDRIAYWVPEDALTVTSWRSGREEPAPLYDRAFLAQKDQYASFLGGNQPLCVIRNPARTGGEKLLLVRDSYSDALAPFLALYFSEVHLLDLRYYRGSVRQYAAENGIGDIAVIYSVPNFITDRNLAFLAQ